MWSRCPSSCSERCTSACCTASPSRRCCLRYAFDGVVYVLALCDVSHHDGLPVHSNASAIVPSLWYSSRLQVGVDIRTQVRWFHLQLCHPQTSVLPYKVPTILAAIGVEPLLCTLAQPYLWILIPRLWIEAFNR